MITFPPPITRQNLSRSTLQTLKEAISLKFQQGWIVKNLWAPLPYAAARRLSGILCFWTNLAFAAARFDKSEFTNSCSLDLYIYGQRPSLLLVGYNKSLMLSFEVSSVCVPLHCSHIFIHRWCCKLRPFLCPLIPLWETLEPVQWWAFWQNNSCLCSGTELYKRLPSPFLVPCYYFHPLGKICRRPHFSCS